MMFLMVHTPEAKAIALEASEKMQAVIDRLPAAVTPELAMVV